MNTILIIEDHPMMVDAIKTSIQGLTYRARVLTAGAFGELASKLSGMDTKTLSLIVADLNLPDSQGFATFMRLRTQFVGVPILIFSEVDDHATQKQVMALGALGFLSKSYQPKVFLERLRAVIASLPQQASLHTGAAQPSITNAPSLQDPMESLTGQQRRVLKLLALGCSSQEIANQLEVSEPTVRSHLTEIYRRLDVKNRTQAIVLYLNSANQHDD